MYVLLLLSSLLTAQAGNKAANAQLHRAFTASQLRTAQLEAMLQDYVDRLTQIEEVIRAQGRNQADKLENIDQVNSEVSRLRGELEVLRFDLDEVKAGQESHLNTQERRQAYDEKRLAQIERYLGVQAPPPPTAEELGLVVSTDSSTEDLAPGQDDPLPADAKGKLDKAVSELEAGRPAVARVILERAASEHADDPLLPEIRYRIAEAWFNEGNYRKAALAFKAVQEHHGNSPWAPWSLLRQGECFAKMGSDDNAKLFYKGVVQRYPRSDAAKDAKQRLR